MSRSARSEEKMPEVVEAKYPSLFDKHFIDLLKSRERESKRQLDHRRFLEWMSIRKLIIVGVMCALNLVIAGVIIGAIVYLIAKTNPKALQYVVPSLVSTLLIILGAKKYLQKNGQSDDK